MKAKKYLNGRPGVRYGIWNSMAKQFQFGIDEPTPRQAQAALFQKIGYDSWKVRFEPRALPPKKKPKKIANIRGRKPATDICPIGDKL